MARAIADNVRRKILSAEGGRLAIFKEAPQNVRGFVLLGLPGGMQKEIMAKLSDSELVELADYLDPDHATDLLQNIGSRRRNKILKRLSKQIKSRVEFLLKFNPQTAAGMMSLDYIEVPKNACFKDIAKSIKRHESRTGRFPAILVVEEGFLAGELPAHALALGKGKEKIAKHVRKVPHLHYDWEEEEIIKAFRRHPHDRIVVLDNDDSILGVIYSDDVLRIIQKHPASALSDFAGVSDEEDVHDPILSKVGHRYKWLILNLATAFLAASVVGLFQETISRIILLAVYMPVIAGMGGNAGTQSLAVLVRGMALNEIELKTGARAVMKETAAGVVNGAINGVIVAIVATVFNQSPLFGLVVGVSMVLNLGIAGLFGSTIPLVMKALGKDPATSATIFITTATDLFGFFVFLGLATLFL